MGIHGNFQESRGSPPNPPAQPHWGGGGDHQASKKIDYGATQPETESAWLLRSINAFPSSIEELADMPVELIGGQLPTRNRSQVSRAFQAGSSKPSESIVT